MVSSGELSDKQQKRPGHLGPAAFFTCLGEVEKVDKGHSIRNPKADGGQSSWSRPLWGSASHSQPEPEAASLSRAKEMPLKIKGLIPSDMWTANMNHCNGSHYFYHLKQGGGISVQDLERLLLLSREPVQSIGFHPWLPMRIIWTVLKNTNAWVPAHTFSFNWSESGLGLRPGSS